MLGSFAAIGFVHGLYRGATEPKRQWQTLVDTFGINRDFDAVDDQVRTEVGVLRGLGSENVVTVFAAEGGLGLSLASRRAVLPVIVPWDRIVDLSDQSDQRRASLTVSRKAGLDFELSIPANPDLVAFVKAQLGQRASR